LLVSVWTVEQLLPQFNGASEVEHGENAMATNKVELKLTLWDMGQDKVSSYVI
jgi:hypothetical protein